MKFNLGRWRLLPGTEAVHPVSVVDARVEGNALVVTGYSKAVRARADALGGAVVTARFSSPMDGVVRVHLAHFKGRREGRPAFDLDYGRSNPSASAGRDERRAWLKAGPLSVSAPAEGEWRFAFLRDGEALTGSEPRAAALLTQGGRTYLREQLSLDPGETVYGLGERFGPLARNGQAVEMWNEDGGTETESAYKVVPFYLTSRGYGVLVNHPGRVSFEVASRHVGRVQFSAEGHALDYYVFGGPTPKAALEQYTALSGRPALPPEWSFGLWLSTSFVTEYDESSALAAIDRMAALSIPLRVFHFDCFWMRELTWCSFLWDRRRFPDPAGTIRRIHERGPRVCVWINPYIAEASPLFAEGAARGLFLRTPEGDVHQTDRWQPGMAIVDFTNAQARDWYQEKLGALLDLGVDAFKTDFGEEIPTDVCWNDGSDPERMHNLYAFLYNRCVFDLLRRRRGEGEAVVFARAAACGSQRFPVHWGGDNSATYGSMAETLRGGLSLGLSGFGFWSHDIGGFVGTPSPDLYKRWAAFGLLSSHSRLHGNDSGRAPWLFDEESAEVLAFFARLKEALLPYLLDAAREACARGWPVLRAMVLEYPEDPVCRHIDRQYLLGPALVVAPVFDPAGRVEYYLPEGGWRNLLTGERVRGPLWRRETHGFRSLPLWVHEERGGRWEWAFPTP